MNVLFLHGGPGYRDYLAPYFAKTFPAPIQPFFYDQAQGLEIQVSDLVIQLGEKVKSIGGPLTLVGHSWGATLALEFLRNHPKSIDGLVVMNACLHHQHFGEECQKEMAARNIKQGDLPSIFFTQAEKADGTRLLETLNTTFRHEMFGKIAVDYLSHFDVLSILKTLPIRVLNIFGSEDVRVPARLLRPLEQLNPNIRNQEIQGAGHFPFLLPQHHKQVVSAIRDFCLRNYRKGESSST